MSGHDASETLAKDRRFMRKSKYAMLRAEDALARVLEASLPLESVEVDSPGQRGLVLASDAYAMVAIPSSDVSRLDGYAVRASDVPGTLSLCGESLAGRDAGFHVGPGKAAYVATGASIPPGADAVVKVEDSEGVYEAGREVGVRLPVSVVPGAGIRRAGSDVGLGACVMEAGTELDGAAMGILAETQGRGRIEVVRRPRVGVLSTGDEVASGAIGDANRPALLAAVAGSGCEAVDLGCVGDDWDGVCGKLREGLESCDVVLSTGGVSMGSRDFVKPALEVLSGGLVFGRVSVKPGKPTSFAVVAGSKCGGGRDRLMFGLPGNPCSALAMFHLLVAPALARLRGLALARCVPPRITCITLSALPRDPERLELHRAQAWIDGPSSIAPADIASSTLSCSVSSRIVARSTGLQTSSRTLSTLAANVLLLVEPGSDPIPAHSTINALVIGSILPSQPTNLSIESSSIPFPPPSSPTKPHQHFTSPQSPIKPTHTAPPPKYPTPSSDRPAHPTSHDRVLIRACVIVASDTCAAGEASDHAGPAAVEALRALHGLALDETPEIIIVPDEASKIATAVERACASAGIRRPPLLVLTSGGTGFATRDVTPEAVAPLLERNAPGIVHALLHSGAQHTPLALLSRPVAGTRGRALVITLPGKPKAVKEGIQALEPILPHTMHILGH